MEAFHKKLKPEQMMTEEQQEKATASLTKNKRKRAA
jgi:hypothetical protein